MTTPPPARIRIRTPAQPATRIRTRTPSIPGEAPTPSRRAPYFTPDDMPREQVCLLGFITKGQDPTLWQGWPNGSCVMGLIGQTKIHRGRTLKTPSGRYHVLRWNQLKMAYLYIKLAANHAEAMSSL